MHTHAYTDTAAWAHLFLWRSELIPAWSHKCHRPHARYKLSTQPFSSLPSLFFFFKALVFSSILSTLHLFSSLCVPPRFLISVSPFGRMLVLLCFFFFHCSLCGFCFLILNNVRVFEPAPLRCLMWGYFPKG